jgi:hypothetical protein
MKNPDRQTGAGKGSKRRPSNEKKFGENYDDIDWGRGRPKENRFIKKNQNNVQWHETVLGFPPNGPMRFIGWP